MYPLNCPKTLNLDVFKALICLYSKILGNDHVICFLPNLMGVVLFQRCRPLRVYLFQTMVAPTAQLGTYLAMETVVTAEEGTVK